MSRRRRVGSRLPRVRRIEYIFDFLEVVRKGYDRKQAMQRLGERKRFFELEKAKALGRGRPFMRKIMKADELQGDCLNLSLMLGYVTRDRDVTITKEGQELLDSGLERRKLLLGSRFLGIYPIAAETFLSIKRNSDEETILPMIKNNILFKEMASPQGITADQTTFEVIRDILTQLDLLNWFTFLKDEERYQKVYLSSTVMNERDHLLAHHSAITFDINGRRYQALYRSCSLDTFKDVLWKEYLKETKYVPRRPVFFSKVRDKVCYLLRIPDRVFNEHIQSLLKGDPELLVVSSGGMVPYTPDLSSLLKTLPIMHEEEYVVYLKMDVK